MIIKELEDTSLLTKYVPNLKTIQNGDFNDIKQEFNIDNLISIYLQDHITFSYNNISGVVRNPYAFSLQKETLKKPILIEDFTKDIIEDISLQNSPKDEILILKLPNLVQQFFHKTSLQDSYYPIFKNIIIEKYKDTNCVRAIVLIVIDLLQNSNNTGIIKFFFNN